MVKSKKVGDRKIEGLYRSLLGQFENSLEKSKRIEDMVNKLGRAQFNDFISKIFHHRMPQKKDFDLPLSHFGFIRIKNYIPISMTIYSKDGMEEIYSIDEDPDLAGLIFGKIHPPIGEK
jgi:hypothetical protein